MSTAIYIYDCLYPSVTREALPRVPTGSPTGVPILWIVLGVSVALSALVVGIIVYRKRAKRNERYFIKCYCLYEMPCIMIMICMRKKTIFFSV